MQSLEERFWSKVDRSSGPDACWPWMASLGTTGYGQFGMERNGKWTMASAPRVAFELTYRPLAPGMDCCHHCDVRPCCNPAHLWEGTRRENIQDCVNKGRARHDYSSIQGEWHYYAKLTDEMVRAIRHSEPETSQYLLAKLYGVSPSTISRVRSGKGWAHIPTPPQRRGKGWQHGELHWTHQHPERVKRGENHPSTGKTLPYAQGINSPTAKLTEEQVREIRARKGQATCKKLAQEYGVAPSIICRVQNYTIWKHLP